MIDDYSDIINVKYVKSSRYPHMSQNSRASQFSPFAALTGYEGSIKNEGRELSEMVLISETRADEINKVLCEHFNDKLEITYFVDDEVKSGGSYKSIQGYVKMINENNELVLRSKERIKLSAIVQIISLLNN